MAKQSKYFSNCKKNNVFCKSLIEQGVVRVKDKNYTIREEVLDKNIRKFENCNIVYGHNDPLIDNGKIIGKLNEVVFLDDEGIVDRNGGIYNRKGWNAIYTIDEQALIDNNLKLEDIAKMDLSTSYYPTFKHKKGTYNGVPVDDEIISFEINNVAVVETGRYDITRGIVNNSKDEDNLTLTFTNNILEQEHMDNQEDEKKEEQPKSEGGEAKEEQPKSEGGEAKSEGGEDKPFEKKDEGQCEGECEGGVVKIDVNQLKQITQLFAQVQELASIVKGEKPAVQPVQEQAPVQEAPVQEEQPKQEVPQGQNEEVKEQAPAQEEQPAPANTEQQNQPEVNVDQQPATAQPQPQVAQAQPNNNINAGGIQKLDGNAMNEILSKLKHITTPEDYNWFLSKMTPFLNANNITEENIPTMFGNSAEVVDNKEEKEEVKEQKEDIIENCKIDNNIFSLMVF